MDIRHDLLSTYLVDAQAAEPAAIEREFQALEDEARERLRQERVAAKDMVLRRTIDMRYQGQWRSLSVPVSTPFVDVQEAIAGFGAAHQREYNYQRAGAHIEIFRLNLTAIGLTPKAELARHPLVDTAPPIRGRRSVGFDDGRAEAAIYWRDDLSPGAAFAGPAVVQQLDATTLVPPGARVQVDAWLNLIMTV